MASKLSMDEQWRADQKLERELRVASLTLVHLAHGGLAGVPLASDCLLLAEALRGEADRLVRRWD